MISDGKICVNVSSLSGEAFSCYVHPDGTVRNLKRMIELLEANNLPPDKQRIVFAGRQLNDDRALKEYGVTDGSTVHLVPALRGGGRWEGGAHRAHAVALFDWDGSMQVSRSRSFTAAPGQL